MDFAESRVLLLGIVVLGLLEAFYKHEAYRQCRDGTSPPTENKGDLPSSPGLSQNNRIGEINEVTGNYKLSFEITPRGTVSGWGSILAFNNGNACCGFGSVSPAIWFYPGATTLYYTIGDSTDGLWRIDTLALPLNVRTAVILVCDGKNVTLIVGAKVYTATQPTYRYVGNLTVYAGDPWYPAANADMRGLKFEILPGNAGLPSSPGLSQNNRIGEIKGVTGNYKLSFEITPRGTVSGWGSILAFNNGNACCGFGSVSPAIWFYPGDTTLYYTIGDSTDGLWRFDTLALPLNVRTAVTLVCDGKNVTLTVGAKVYTATQPTYRYVGNLTVYAGDPWYPAANADIRGLTYEILPATKSYGASLPEVK